MARKGEVTIEVEGQTYRLVLNLNAMMAAEDATDQSFAELMEKCAKGRLSAIRTVLWAALQEHHPRMSLKDVGEWMERAGLDTLLAGLTAMSVGTVPDAADAKELGIKPARPRKARTAA